MVFTTGRRRGHLLLVVVVALIPLAWGFADFFNFMRGAHQHGAAGGTAENEGKL